MHKCKSPVIPNLKRARPRSEGNDIPPSDKGDNGWLNPKKTSKSSNHSAQVHTRHPIQANRFAALSASDKKYDLCFTEEEDCVSTNETSTGRHRRFPESTLPSQHTQHAPPGATAAAAPAATQRSSTQYQHQHPIRTSIPIDQHTDDITKYVEGKQTAQAKPPPLYICNSTLEQLINTLKQKEIKKNAFFIRQMRICV